MNVLKIQIKSWRGTWGDTIYIYEWWVEPYFESNNK